MKELSLKSLHLAPPLPGSAGISGLRFPTLKCGANIRCAYGAGTAESVLQTYDIRSIALPPALPSIGKQPNTAETFRPTGVLLEAM
jgi:hypothetical protein